MKYIAPVFARNHKEKRRRASANQGPNLDQSLDDADDSEDALDVK